MLSSIFVAVTGLATVALGAPGYGAPAYGAPAYGAPGQSQSMSTTSESSASPTMGTASPTMSTASKSSSIVMKTMSSSSMSKNTMTSSSSMSKMTSSASMSKNTSSTMMSMTKPTTCPTSCQTKTITKSASATTCPTTGNGNPTTITVTSTATATSTPTASCGAARTANFDDIPLGLINTTQLALYEGLDYSALDAGVLGNAPLLGLKAHSGEQVVTFGPTTLLLQGKPMLFPVGSNFFNFQSFYFGCVAAASTTVASVALPCTINVDGFRDGQQVATQSFKFTPNILAFGGNNMMQATLSAAFTNLEQVTFSSSGLLAVADLVALDDLVYQTCSYKP
ncbi:uncharacterized protein RCC_10888 [Ramularia collo-cygni]|uniref:Uncharacterized protein n=1 Tax=Ramularia collo-cygni TaxID=112498 RepID=A0A2D3VMQ8_9PEZI|nr:uncharacterized protein RCC_10888 [Ramularia collo-cygni]CZT25159.1 uncharacterized protein RCC_10888 [Ramularia collo-cygni]